MTTPHPEQEPKPKKKKPPTLLVALLTLIVVGLCSGIGVALFSGGSEDQAPDPIADDDSIAAQVMCEDFVKERLKSPASAEFPKPQIDKSGAAYVVTGAVDSQNSFGAMIRNEYVCKVTNQGNDQWHLDDLAFSES